jgi:hypothetical protein
MCTLLFVVRLSLGEIRGEDSSTVVCRLFHCIGRCLRARANGASGTAAASAAAGPDGGSGAAAGALCRGAQVAGSAPAQEVVQVPRCPASPPAHEAHDALVRRTCVVRSFGRAQPFGCARLRSPVFA